MGRGSQFAVERMEVPALHRLLTTRLGIIASHIEQGDHRGQCARELRALVDVARELEQRGTQLSLGGLGGASPYAV